jgi:hypothetical protein
MKHRYAGWMRRKTSERWYQVCESHEYADCLNRLLQWARDNQLKVSGSLVVLPCDVKPTEMTKRRK